MTATNDLSDEFFRDTRDLSVKLGCAPTDALKVWFSESIGINAKAKNPGGAAGINQITNLRRAGFPGTVSEYLDLTPEEQLPYVANYYAPYYGRLKSVARLYQVNYLPATFNSATKPGDILAVRDGVNGWAYADNSSLDVGRKGFITLDDLEKVANGAIFNTSPVKAHMGTGTLRDRWLEIVSRLAGTGTTSAATPLPPQFLIGQWLVTIDKDKYFYRFRPDGTALWADVPKPAGAAIAWNPSPGRWQAVGSELKLTWKNSREVWSLPLALTNQKGTVTYDDGTTDPLVAQKKFD